MNHNLPRWAKVNHNEKRFTTVNHGLLRWVGEVSPWFTKSYINWWKSTKIYLCLFLMVYYREGPLTGKFRRGVSSSSLTSRLVSLKNQAAKFLCCITLFLTLKLKSVSKANQSIQTLNSARGDAAIHTSLNGKKHARLQKSKQSFKTMFIKIH